MNQMGSTPEGEFQANAGYSHPMGPMFGQTLANMRFMGWVGRIYGILTCLSIVGAIAGIPMIIATNRYLAGIDRLENYRRENSMHELRVGFEELGGGFRLMKILVLIYIVLTFGYLAFMFMLGGVGLLSELASS